MSAATGRRDAWVMALVGFSSGLTAGLIAIVVRRFFATDAVVDVVAAAGVAAAAFGAFALVRSFASGARALWRPRATAALLFATLSLFLSIVVCGWLHRQTLASLADRSQKVVDALYAFKRDRGEFPATLDALLAEHLAEIPRTAMRGDPTYAYVREAKDRFELSVDLHGTGEGSRLFYRSSSDYAPGVEVVRAWGFEP
jgi:hypothetical protein